jgi:hypothetical protein
MHETYRMMVQHQIDERLREAAEWRRADEARSRREARDVPAALRARFASIAGRAGIHRQTAAPVGTAVAADGSPCA